MKRDSSLLHRVPRAAWVLITGTFAGTAIFLATSFGPTGSIASRGSIDEQTPTPPAQVSQAMLANSTSTATSTSTASPTVVEEVSSSSTEGAVHPDNISEEQPAPETGESAPAVGTSRFVMPLASWVVVTDRFGAARGAGLVHGGIDLALDGGNHSPVMASCNGTASTAYNSTYGYHVIVNCGGGWATLYAHLSEILVKNGQAVAQYGVLGISGSTGFSTGEHLHFEIHYNGVRVNPEYYLDFKIPAGTPLSSGPIWYAAPGAGLNPAVPAGSTGGSGGSGGSGATAGATSTSTSTSTATAEPKATNTPVPPTNTPTATATATSTFTPTATFTPQPPTPTRTPTPKPVFIP